ncbi:MAG: hypothetical protein HOO67_03020 [Candidatus Peribacteraceae bacterium]|nr:hypothetical protein [Candidatus Peribacteraceae bacterium]
MPGFAAFASHAPSRIVTNEQLPVQFTEPNGKLKDIKGLTGIESRRIAVGETITSMGVEVVLQLLTALGIRIQDCGGLILSTCALDADHQAHLLADAIGLPHDRYVRGINDACTGFVSATQAGNALAKTTDRPILVIASDKTSDLTDFSDPQTAILFGDGAAGGMIAPDGRDRILDVFSRVLPNWPNILGLRDAPEAMDIHGNKSRRKCIHMPGGLTLYRKVPDMMVDFILEGVRRAGILNEDVKDVYSHHANGNILERMKESFLRKGWMKPPMVANRILHMGNMGSVSIARLLADLPAGPARIAACPAVGAAPDLANSGELTGGNIIIALAQRE